METNEYSDKDFHKDMDLSREYEQRSNELLMGSLNKLKLKSEKVHVPDHIWHTLSIRFFTSGLSEQALETMLLAIKAGESLEGDDRRYLRSIYGDLAMIQDKLERYDDAIKSMESSLHIAKKYYGEEHKHTIDAQRKLEKLRIKAHTLSETKVTTG